MVSIDRGAAPGNYGRGGVTQRMCTSFLNFLKDDRGQDLIEYTLLLAFVSIASVVIFADAGTSVNTVWKDAKNQLSNAVIASS